MKFILRPETTQTVTVTDTAADSAAIGGVGIEKIWVRLMGDVDMHIAGPGATPTATTSDMPIAAWQDYFIQMNRTEIISAIQNSANGTLWITQVT